jgi:hypothetical protein
MKSIRYRAINRVPLAGAVLLVVAGLAGCKAPVPGQGIATASAVAPSPSATSQDTWVGDHLGPVIVDGPGWTASGLEGEIPAPGSCHIRWTADKEPLPDPKCTPGAVDGRVTIASLGSTVCRKGGYTASVRPPAAMTEAAKKKIMAAYGIPWSEASKYELDHEVELAAGGASDVRNLWPEPNTFVSGQAKESSFVHNDKDQVEADIFDALCTGKVDLVEAQNTMAEDWTTAEARLGITARKP